MNKKVFTLLLLAVFMLAQFSTASATAEPGATTALAALPAFHDNGDISLDWSVTDMDGLGTQNVFLWARATPSLHTDWDDDANFCWGPFNVNGLASANGTYLFHTDNSADDDQDVVDFMVTVSDQATCTLALADTAAADPAQAGTFIDEFRPSFLEAMPPYLDTDITGWNNPVSCNTFEMWSIASDHVFPLFLTGPGSGYSGFKGWNQSVTGTFAPPAPEGPASELLSWEYTFPSTASGPWTFSIRPEDYAGNSFGPWPFRSALAIVDPDELEDCKDFSDTAGHANEVYIRYLADLGLISGFADGTFGPDTTLTRAEAATLFEKANGWADEVGLPAAPPSVDCTFTDVTAADWFAGWVWQACDDGFMNGIGGGLFDPNNLLTRGQVVTIFNNIAITPDAGAVGGYLEDDGPGEMSVLNWFWGYSAVIYGREFREAAWTDVMIGAYYATPVIRAYGAGVADGTSDTTFSPDQAATRGEFAKMLYRALSRNNP